KNFAEDFVRYWQGFLGIVVVDLGMQRHIHNTERELPPISGAFGRELGFFKFGEDFSRNFFGRVAVVRSETIENLFVPDPVLEHLRGGLDKCSRTGSGTKRFSIVS